LLVLVTNREDVTADFVALELERRGEPFVRVCSEDYPTRMGIHLSADRAVLELQDRSIQSDDIRAVWWRRSIAPVMPKGDNPARSAWAAREADAAWTGFWQSVRGHWVNEPQANAHAECKPTQLREALRQGLRVPPTLVTNRLAAALDFQNQHGSIICKALAGPLLDEGRMLYTQLLDQDVFDRIDSLGPEPSLFQAFEEKEADVRATVIGERVLACRIESQVTPATAVDWRRGDSQELDHVPIDLDEHTSCRLCSLTASFGLRFAAIDLALDREGRYVFFEINPNGQWAWVEQLTGQPITAALVDELVGH